ncbi:MAG: sulfatase [Planctomycetes bacterium]|nr:sulfatase [Planctomycetota bacterium]
MNSRALLLCASLAVAAPSCAEPEMAPNVVLLVLDTVRADHLSAYGYSRPTSPRLAALCERADRYALARSTAPWTLPSHASLFTGKFPFQHLADAELVDAVFNDARPLSEEELTLAEALAAEGYATAAFAANRGYVNERMGLTQGFATFVNERHPGVGMSELAHAWVKARPQGQPFFLFVNYMDAHRPYNVAPVDGPNEAALPPASEENPSALLDALYEQVYGADAPPDPALVRKAIDAYDRGIANADRGAGELLARLEQDGLLDGALVIVTADHGEYLGEHDLVEHSKDVYEPALRVPLIVKRPGQSRGRVIEEPASIADVPGLVLAELPEAVRAKHAGQFPGQAGVRGLFAEINYSRGKDMAAPWGERFLRERSALYLERWKVIRSSDGKHELYDLASDPREERNLFAERPREAQLLLDTLARIQARSGGARARVGVREPTEDELKELRELGY